MGSRHPHSHTSTNPACRLEGFGRNYTFFLSDKLCKLAYRNLQLSLVLPEKKTHKSTQSVFVMRAFNIFGDPRSVFTETGELCPGLDLLPLSFMHLWFKLKIFGLRLNPAVTQLPLDQDLWEASVPPAIPLTNRNVTLNCTNQRWRSGHLKSCIAGPAKRDTDPLKKRIMNWKLISAKETSWEIIRWAILEWNTPPGIKEYPWLVVTADLWWN